MRGITCSLWDSCSSPLAVTSPDASVRDGAPTLSLLQAVLGTLCWEMGNLLGIRQQSSAGVGVLLPGGSELCCDMENKAGAYFTH